MNNAKKLAAMRKRARLPGKGNIKMLPGFRHMLYVSYVVEVIIAIGKLPKEDIEE